MLRLSGALRAVLLVALIALAPAPARAEGTGEAEAAPVCANGLCQVKARAAELLAHAETLVQDGKYAEAQPLLAALSAAPGYALQTRFRKGYVDSRTGDLNRDDYDGRNMGAYATYERVFGHALIASASVFARRDDPRADAVANTEVGGVFGLGGELPKGFNFGVSAGASRAVYDAAMPFFSLDPRRDWRLNGRVTPGNRAVRVWGFSPSVSYSYGRSDSSIAYCATQRSRVRPALARYF